METGYLGQTEVSVIKVRIGILTDHRVIVLVDHLESEGLVPDFEKVTLRGGLGRCIISRTRLLQSWWIG